MNQTDEIDLLDAKQDNFYEGGDFDAEKDLDKFFQDNIFQHNKEMVENKLLLLKDYHIFMMKKRQQKPGKDFNCIGTINKDKEGQLVITLSGDQRMAVQTFLIEEGIGKKENIKIHGA